MIRPLILRYFPEQQRICYSDSYCEDEDGSSEILWIEIFPTCDGKNIDRIIAKLRIGSGEREIELDGQSLITNFLDVQGCNLDEKLACIISLMPCEDIEAILTHFSCEGTYSCARGKDICSRKCSSTCRQKSSMISLFVGGIATYLVQVTIFCCFPELYPFNIDVVTPSDNDLCLGQCPFAYLRPYLSAVKCSELLLLSGVARAALDFIEIWSGYFILGMQVENQINRACLSALEGFTDFALTRVAAATSPFVLDKFRDGLAEDNEKFLCVQKEKFCATLVEMREQNCSHIEEQNVLLDTQIDNFAKRVDCHIDKFSKLLPGLNTLQEELTTHCEKYISEKMRELSPPEDVRRKTPGKYTSLGIPELLDQIEQLRQQVNLLSNQVDSLTTQLEQNVSLPESEPLRANLGIIPQ